MTAAGPQLESNVTFAESTEGSGRSHLASRSAVATGFAAVSS